MNFSTVVIVAILVLIGVLAIRSYRKKLSGGCCGGSDSVKRVRVADRNKANYPYHKVAAVEGMVCQNCARRVENAFNAQDGCFATVDTEKKTADIYGKSPLSDAFIPSTVAQAGYSVRNVKEI